MAEDIRIKTRRDIINLVMIKTMDDAGIDTSWVGRLAYLKGVRKGITDSDATIGSELALTLIELNRMIEELEGFVDRQRRGRHRG